MLKKAKAIAGGKVVTKSGLMLGLGEKEHEIIQAMDDLRAHDVTVLTMGQYLRPSPRHLPVVNYIKPEKFDEYKEIALAKGFRHVASGPLVRSSYHARHVASGPLVRSSYHAADFRPELDLIEDIEKEAAASKA